VRSSFLRRFKQAPRNPLKTLCGGSCAVVLRRFAAVAFAGYLLLMRRFCGGLRRSPPQTPPITKGGLVRTPLVMNRGKRRRSSASMPSHERVGELGATGAENTCRPRGAPAFRTRRQGVGVYAQPLASAGTGRGSGVRVPKTRICCAGRPAASWPVF
jgi:hypothetical protein